MGHTHASPWSASLMSVAVLLLVERHQSAGQDQVERIDCQTNATSTNCPLGKVCSVTCPADCPKKVTVYGTQFYRYDSPICAAAGHDLRLSPWNERSLSVAFIRSDRKLRRYKGSYRNGFTSLSAEELDEQNTHKGWYSFISPRITEPIFDLTSVHVHYRHRPNETHVQICFGPPGRQVTFSHFGRTLSPYPTPTEHDGVFKLVWPVGDNGASSGAFVCAVQGSVLSSATSVAMPRMRNFLSALSQTINLYETAQLKNANGEGGVWSKDGLTLGRPVVKNNNSEVEVTPATLGDGGLYMFRAKGADFEQVSRLIVRACEDGKYGHVCAEACPRCRNGGVCHDITGVCICPPGFTGEHCETPCKPYHFGQNCSHNCTEVQSLAKGSDPKCAGLLFCLPDPYGCSCYPGFYGIDCTRPCKNGAYGANCKLRRTCHCQLDEGCNQHSGVCSKRTCKEGYRDEPYCDKLYPVLHSFSAVALTEYSIEAEWSPWSSKVDRGEGEPDGYIIQFKELDRMEWNRTDIIPDPGNGTLSYVITGLKPNTDYQVQVLVHDTSGHVHSQTAHTERKKTRCGVPGPPSQVYQEGRQETAVVVAWKEPRLSNGVIHGYKVTLVNLNSPAAENVSKVGPEARKVQFDGLEAGTAYVAEVSARTSAGYGKPVNITVYTRPRVPVIETKAELKSVSETAITLQLAALGDQPDDIEAYYVLVQRHYDRKNRTRRSAGDSSEASVGDSALYEWTGGTPDYNESVAMNLSFYMAAKLTPDEVKSQGEFTVGDGRYYGGYYNAPLIPEATYSVGLAAEVNFQGDRRISYQLLTEPITVRKQDPSSGFSPGTTAAIVCIVILVLAVIAALWKWRGRLLGRLPGGFRQRSKPPVSDAGSLSIADETDGVEFQIEDTSGRRNGLSSKPLPLSGLQDYVQRMLACDGLKSEFISQPRGRQYPAVESRRVENKLKNRYGNLLAYDHSRVKLKPISGVPYSDYINANYIDGYCRPKRYIATQAPKPNTVDDFWRMVWQENVCKIVMLTGLVENGKTKCEKYWPANSANYGEVQVNFMGEENFPNYTVHQLHITQGGTTREVKHFHLRSWPDNGVPLYPNVLLRFRKKVNQYKSFNKAPVVVHCCTGTAQTGAYILLDNILEQADAEGVVDVVGQLAVMRQNRMNIVETPEQYNLVHRALMESVCMRDHSVPCSKVVERYREMLLVDEVSGKSHLVKEFEELRSLKPCFKPADFTVANDPADLIKIRDVSILDPERCHPLMKSGTFVNAVYVNGFHKKDKFLVTQTPSSKDVDHLWKMVIESGTRTIVTLDVFGEDSEVVPFWPKEGSVPYGDHKVECLERQNVNDMSVQVFKITSKHKGPGSSGAETVRHFHLSTWKSPKQMVDLVDHVERWQQQSGHKTILVQCRDGCFASGLFCCCALVLEKLKCEQEVDVFYATRIIRESRPQFIVDSDQYKFCYEAAITCLHNFEMYANFRE